MVFLGQSDADAFPDIVTGNADRFLKGFAVDQGSAHGAGPDVAGAVEMFTFFLGEVGIELIGFGVIGICPENAVFKADAGNDCFFAAECGQLLQHILHICFIVFRTVGNIEQEGSFRHVRTDDVCLCA